MRSSKRSIGEIVGTVFLVQMLLVLFGGYGSAVKSDLASRYRESADTLEWFVPPKHIAMTWVSTHRLLRRPLGLTHCSPGRSRNQKHLCRQGWSQASRLVAAATYE